GAQAERRMWRNEGGQTLPEQGSHGVEPGEEKVLRRIGQGPDSNQALPRPQGRKAEKAQSSDKAGSKQSDGFLGIVAQKGKNRRSSLSGTRRGCPLGGNGRACEHRLAFFPCSCRSGLGHMGHMPLHLLHPRSLRARKSDKSKIFRPGTTARTTFHRRINRSGLWRQAIGPYSGVIIPYLRLSSTPSAGSTV